MKASTKAQLVTFGVVYVAVLAGIFTANNDLPVVGGSVRRTIN